METKYNERTKTIRQYVFVNKHILPPVMKFVNTKAIQALQNGMIYTLPLSLLDLFS